MKVRIVLVEPHEAGNVGAAARAMKNFGFTDLWIAGPRPQRPDNISEWWAKGAMDVVESATRVATLEEALADVHLSVATTAVRARQVFEQLLPHDVAQLAAEHLSDDQTLALVFGREESGLSGREVALCRRTAVIPTSPAFPTMNLAQSVAVFCYELGKGLRPAVKKQEPAAGHLLQVLDSRARRLFEEVNFFGEKDADRMCAELKAVAGRAVLTTREASLLLSLVSQLQKSREKP